jgi:serine/threonine protein kinase
LGPGDKLGKYDLIRQIAIGGMAELYLARTVGIEGFEKLSVIKRILPQFATNATFVDMFLNEARLAATLHHPNVAQVYDIGLENGDYFFAMEYVHGEDLDRMSAQSVEQGVPISLDAVLTLVAGLCAGLHYAHEKAGPDGIPLQIVHRDVSPSNVLVSYDGAVKLVDFGIARGAQAKPTTKGGLKGKIAYMSPEQCRADVALDRRSDIYSIGTMLYELSTGRTPFVGETEYAVLNQIVNTDVPPPTAFLPNYPPALERIVLRALARDPMKRFTTAVELQGELEDFAHDNRLRVSPLVLARLMGTLFPARLEEWDHAKSQGAFFVEQHVVRTLIESGKTPDPNDPEVRAQIKAMAQQLEIDDPTAVNQDLEGGDSTATTQVEPLGTRISQGRIVQNSPLALPKAPTPPPGAAHVAPLGSPRAQSAGEPSRRDSTPHVARAPSRGSAPELPPPPAVARTTPLPGTLRRTPVPGMPGAVPIMSYPVAHGGTMVSHPSPGDAATHASHAVDFAHAIDDEDAVPTTPDSQFDVTERVQARRHATPTNFVRAAPRRKGPIVVVVLCAAAAAGIALFIAFGGSSPSVPTAPATEVAPAPTEPTALAPAPVAAPPAADIKAEPPPTPTPPPPTEPAAASAPPVDEPAPKPAAHPVAVRKPAPAPARPRSHPVAKPKPEDKPAWNADSPFMPVRTDKH